MKKIIAFAWDNILYLYTLFLLAFVPLYPKLPLIDVKNTWVYVRLDDFAVVVALLLWVFFLIRKKITLKSPITIPIMVFWIVGAIATIHGVVIIFPTLANVFPNVAFLAFLRHIEYLGLFFVAFAGMRDKKFLKPAVLVLTLTLLGVVFYGFGQKFLQFPAYLTMNEQYAKGVPIILSQLSRVPSTFAGQYDLAAYLVLIIPLLVSMIFGFKNWLVRAALLISSLLGFFLLFMTVSRVSFVVVLVALFFLLFLQKKRLVLYSIPFIALFLFLFVTFSPSLASRFGNTLKQVDVLVDGKTGVAVGEVKFVPVGYFKDKTIRQERVSTSDQLTNAMSGQPGNSVASPSAILPFKLIAPLGQVPLVTAANVSNGENLPQGTGYVNLSLSPVIKRVGNFFYELGSSAASGNSEILILHGDFIIKRATAYDLSFTTRFQGEWPHAVEAFQRNVLVGSGYGSISLAIDNNYLRMLGETGLLGVIAFFGVFIAVAIYIRKILDDIDDPVARNFVLGYAAGVVGLALNATLIDVFEASKIAYLLWMLTGITLGILVLYQKGKINLFNEFKNVATSSYAIMIYIFVAAVTILSPMLSNYFVGDDFTWFRWAADCGNKACQTVPTILNYFTNSAGFFYRPGTKTFFYFMYQTFWLNPVVYHAVSVLLHLITVILFFLLAQKVLKDKMLGAGAAFLFLIMSGYQEAVFWIASIGFLFNAVFALSALLLFDLWREKKNPVFYVLTLFSLSFALIFHEVGIIVPFLIILYQSIFEGLSVKRVYQKMEYLILFIPDIIYLFVRFISGSHWQGGDYSYNLLKLPFNLVGNIVGYIALTYLGPLSLSGYERLRDVLRSHLVVAVIILAGAFALLFFLYKMYQKNAKKFEKHDLQILIFGILFFAIAALPFLPLGNIASRYTYLPSLGLVIILVWFFKKLYTFLLLNGREIAVGAMVVVLSSFALLHIIQTQQITLDWGGAGQEAQNFLIALDDSYADYFSTEPMELHFVNVPSKVGQAWVFPVGIEDAVWLSFKNPRVKIYNDSSVNYDLQSKISRNTRVFEFNGDGSVTEIQPPKKLQPEITPTPVVPAFPIQESTPSVNHTYPR